MRLMYVLRSVWGTTRGSGGWPRARRASFVLRRLASDRPNVVFVARLAARRCEHEAVEVNVAACGAPRVELVDNVQRHLELAPAGVGLRLLDDQPFVMDVDRLSMSGCPAAAAARMRSRSITFSSR
jgi:hypothetical protein